MGTDKGAFRGLELPGTSSREFKASRHYEYSMR